MAYLKMNQLAFGVLVFLRKFIINCLTLPSTYSKTLTVLRLFSENSDMCYVNLLVFVECNKQRFTYITVTKKSDDCFIKH